MSKLYMDDVRYKDGDAIKEMAARDDFFYVFINDNGGNGGKQYAALGEIAYQARQSKLPQQEPGAKGWAQHKLSAVFGLAAKATPYENVWMKGLRDEGGKLAGVCVLMQEKTGKSEIGYFLHPEYQGKGLGIQMARSTLKWAMDNTSISTVYGDVDPNNEVSCHMLEKLGMDTIAREAPVGKYKDKEGQPIAERIMEGTRENIEARLNEYEAQGGTFLEVRDNATKHAPALRQNLSAPTYGL